MGILLDPKCFPTHPSEEILEEYVFRRLPDALAAPVEEHLLICPGCQESVTEIDGFVTAVKIAARNPDWAHHTAPAIGPVGWGGRNILILSRLTSRKSLAPIFVIAILAFLAVRKDAQVPPAPVGVGLSSLRGPANLSPAPLGKPLQLSIEAPDLARGIAYQVEVVDAAGGLIWKGPVTETDGKLAATVSKPLSQGVYWVRLYGPDAELLREFGLSAE